MYKDVPYLILPRQSTAVFREVSSIINEQERAIPDLLNALADARPTSLSHKNVPQHVGFKPWFDDNYRSSRDRGKQELELLESGYGEYMTLGDLCHFILGQIVNRQYSAGIGQFVGPSRCPKLVELARFAWHDTTREELIQSLKSDIMLADNFRRSNGAIIRLSVLSFASMENVVARKLGLPIVSISMNVLTYYQTTKEARRWPNYNLVDEVLATIGASMQFESGTIDSACAALIGERTNREYDTGDHDTMTVQDQDYVAFMGCVRLLISTRRYDALITAFSNALLSSGGEWQRKQGAWLQACLKSKERSSWRDPRWFHD
ncbi:MAG: hypothetical protein WD716_10295 [Fimbriimonadaceae bacterium]